MGRLVFIVGMHRSGTSCLAGSLERCGLYLGKVRRTGHFNARGYYERQDVGRLHDQVLALNHASWCRPPDRVEVHDHHRRALHEVVEQLSVHKCCGLKDPRLVLLLDTWLELVNTPLALVGTFRHPVAVAQSLARRNGIPENDGLALWMHYNSALVQHHRVSPFPMVEYDLSDVDAYCRVIEAAAVQLGLQPHFFQLRRFISQDLEHHPSADLPVPSQCREVYAYWRRHCLRPDGGNSPGSFKQRRMFLTGMVREALFQLSHPPFSLLRRPHRALRRLVGQN